MWKPGFIWAVILTLAKMPSMKTCGVEELQVETGTQSCPLSTNTRVTNERNDRFGFTTLDLFSLAGGQILDRLLVEG